MKVILREQQVTQVVKDLAIQIIDRYGSQPITIVPIMTGAAYLAVDLSRELGELGCDHHFHPVFCSSYQGQTQVETNIFLGNVNKLKGRHLILFDEIFDTGKTFFDIKEAIRAQIPEAPIQTCAAFFKVKEQYPFELPDLIGIRIHDVWMLGCGLDDLGSRRYLKELLAMPKAEGVPHSEDDRMFTDESFYQSLFDGENYRGAP